MAVAHRGGHGTGAPSSTTPDRAGRYERVRRGLYRLRHFPSSLHDHVMAAWLPLPEPAVVSHESALALRLSDVIPNGVHITLPRASEGDAHDRASVSHTIGNPPGASSHPRACAPQRLTAARVRTFIDRLLTERAA